MVMPCGFESHLSHQTNIIRTKFSLWETGSDYLFSLASSRKPISETVSLNDQNQSPEDHGNRNRFRKTLLWIRKIFLVSSISIPPVSRSGLYRYYSVYRCQQPPHSFRPLSDLWNTLRRPPRTVSFCSLLSVLPACLEISQTL